MIFQFSFFLPGLLEVPSFHSITTELSRDSKFSKQQRWAFDASDAFTNSSGSSFVIDHMFFVPLTVSVLLLFDFESLFLQGLQSWFRRDLSHTWLDSLASNTEGTAIAVSLFAAVSRLDPESGDSTLHRRSRLKILFFPLVCQDRHLQRRRSLVRAQRYRRLEGVHICRDGKESYDQG